MAKVRRKKKSKAARRASNLNKARKVRKYMLDYNLSRTQARIKAGLPAKRSK